MPDMRNAQAGARCHEVDVLTPATTRDTLEPPGHAASTDDRPGLRKDGVAVNAVAEASIAATAVPARHSNMPRGQAILLESLPVSVLAGKPDTSDGGRLVYVYRLRSERDRRRR